jgi:hypothetical protein
VDRRPPQVRLITTTPAAPVGPAVHWSAGGPDRGRPLTAALFVSSTLINGFSEVLGGAFLPFESSSRKMSVNYQRASAACLVLGVRGPRTPSLHEPFKMERR